MPSKSEVIEKRKRAAENWAVRSRNYRRARERALTALARRYKEDYLALLEEEKKKDEQEGKRWNNLAGIDVPGNFDISTHYAGKNRRNTTDISQDESDNE
mgnify:CR=1 FL=1